MPVSAPAPAFEGLFVESIERTELSACSTASSFLQSDFWGSFKGKFGWQALAFRVTWNVRASNNDETNDPCETSLLVLCRSLIKGRFSLAYIPWGPELPDHFPDDDAKRGSALHEIARALKEVLPVSTVFIRFDPPWYSEGRETPPPRIPTPLIRATADIQAPDTVIVDLRPPMEEILAAMKSKWRYNARLAVKKGVTLRRASVTEDSEINEFYNLLTETARRDGIAIHGKEYYQTLLHSKAFGIDTRLYFAEHEGKALASIVTLFCNQKATYLYGASSGEKRNLMAMYALQVKAMEDAKAENCSSYDLFGIPPNDDPAHPMAGLYRFKTGFGGAILHRPGSLDYPCRSLLYRLFRTAETLRKNIRSLKKNRVVRKLQFSEQLPYRQQNTQYFAGLVRQLTELSNKSKRRRGDNAP